MLKTAASSDLTNLRGMKVGLLTIQSLKRLRRQHIQDWVKRHRVTFTEPQQASYQHHTHTHTCTHTHTHTCTHTHSLSLTHTHTSHNRLHRHITHIHTCNLAQVTPSQHSPIRKRPHAHGQAQVTPSHHSHRTGSHTITQDWQSHHHITHTGLAVTLSHH